MFYLISSGFVPFLCQFLHEMIYILRLRFDNIAAGRACLLHKYANIPKLTFFYAPASLLILGSYVL